MQIRCTYCQTMFPISRDEMLAALQHMEVHKQKYYDAHCPKCRRANRVEGRRIEIFIPDWRKTIKAMEQQAAGEGMPAEKPVLKAAEKPVVKAVVKPAVKAVKPAVKPAVKKAAEKAVGAVTRNAPPKPAVKTPAAKKPAGKAVLVKGKAPAPAKGKAKVAGKIKKK